MGSRGHAVSKLWRVGMLAALGATAVEGEAQDPLEGTLLVVNKGEATASVIDVASGQRLALLPTGEGPHELALSSDGRTAVATNYGGPTGGNTLTVIDVPSAAVVSTVSLGQYRRPHGAAFLPGDSLLAVTSETSEAVIIVRIPEGSVVRSLRTGQRGSHMLAVTEDGRTIYTGNIGDNTVTELDVVEGQKRLFQVPAQPEAITVDAEGHEVWVGSNAEGKVSVVGTRDGMVESPFAGFTFPYRIVLLPTRGVVLVPDATENTLRVFDLQNRNERGRVDFPDAGPQGITVTPDERWAFQSLSQQGRVAMIDLETLRVVRYLETGEGPDGVAWSPLSSRGAPEAPSDRRGSVQDRGEEGAVLGVIRTLFDGMREADSLKVRGVLARGVRFAAVGERDGEPVIEYPTVDGWITGVGRSEGRWDERIADVVIQVDGNVASAWMSYSFYLDGELSHCGVDSMEFLRSSQGWRITQISDTRRTEGCQELPAEDADGGPGVR